LKERYGDQNVVDLHGDLRLIVADGLGDTLVEGQRRPYPNRIEGAVGCMQDASDLKVAVREEAVATLAGLAIRTAEDSVVCPVVDLPIGQARALLDNFMGP
jgi:hypothetical protein